MCAWSFGEGERSICPGNEAWRALIHCLNQPIKSLPHLNLCHDMRACLQQLSCKLCCERKIFSSCGQNSMSASLTAVRSLICRQISGLNKHIKSAKWYSGGFFWKVPHYTVLGVCVLLIASKSRAIFAGALRSAFNFSHYMEIKKISFCVHLQHRAKSALHRVIFFFCTSRPIAKLVGWLVEYQPSPIADQRECTTQIIYLLQSIEKFVQWCHCLGCTNLQCK